MLYIVASVVAFVWLINFLLLEMKKPKNFPRGPFFYPIIGNALSVARARKECGMLVKGIRKLADDFPNEKDLIAFKVGKDRIVFTLSAKSIIEAYLNQDLDGRPFGAFYETRTWNLRRGILMTDGDFFTTQHRFVVRQLRDFGFARKGMKEICEAEAEFCLNDFRKMIESNDGRCMTVTLPNIHALYILNSLWQFMASVRYNPDNEELKLLQKILDDLFKSIDMTGALFSHFPILQHIAPEASGYNSFVKHHNNLHKFMRKEIEKHKKNFNPSDEPCDLIDAYLKALYTGDESGSQIHESFSELQLLAICLDMFMAGSETTMKSLNFMFLHLVRDSHIQKKARHEIDRVIGRHRLPKLADRVNLPYCEAIVNEALRTFTRYTCGVPHRAMRDTKLCGFDIPRDTMVVPMFASLMNDETVYKDPLAFNPENFLDPNGKLQIPDKHWPFGLGKRRCIGESLARSNLFLMCTTLLQNFYFEVPIGHDLPSDDPVEGATATVLDYEALIILRN